MPAKNTPKRKVKVVSVSLKEDVYEKWANIPPNFRSKFVNWMLRQMKKSDWNKFCKQLEASV